MMFLPDYKHKGRGAKPQRLILLFKHLTSRANQAMNSWNMESKATRMNVDLLHENTAAQNGRTFTPGAAVVEGHHHFCEAPKEGMMEMGPAALPGAGLSHRAGQGCKAAPLPTRAPAQPPGSCLGSRGCTVRPQPRTARVIYLGKGINKRAITAIYIKLDILKALCKH